MTRHASRFPFAAPSHHALVVGLQIAVAVIAACLLTTAAAAATAPVTSDQFAAGWQQKSQALFLRGPMRDGRDAWELPDRLPRGHYVLVGKEDGRIIAIQGSSFDVDTIGFVKRTMFVPSGITDVMAVPADMVPAPR
jgi:hypothetical protein